MKPSWKNAPEWAEYLAQDYKDGNWYWYSIKPYRCSVKDFVWCCVPDSKYKLAGISDPNPEWKETLERRPNDMARLRKVEEEPAMVDVVLTPTEFEIHNSDQTFIARVSMVDEYSARVVIENTVNNESWGDISQCIHKALDKMFSGQS